MSLSTFCWLFSDNWLLLEIRVQVGIRVRATQHLAVEVQGCGGLAQGYPVLTSHFHSLLRKQVSSVPLRGWSQDSGAPQIVPQGKYQGRSWSLAGPLLPPAGSSKKRLPGCCSRAKGMLQAGGPRIHPSEQAGTVVRMCISVFEDKLVQDQRGEQAGP